MNLSLNAIEEGLTFYKVITTEAASKKIWGLLRKAIDIFEDGKLDVTGGVNIIASYSRAELQEMITQLDHINTQFKKLVDVMDDDK